MLNRNTRAMTFLISAQLGYSLLLLEITSCSAFGALSVFYDVPGDRGVARGGQDHA